ncbi:hypothetical protein FRB94_002874 [Tulasnella sp. JGI-2019a]|nr:hypothetical protein FRB94_002874 [Tulasnella sp. JGI-2019a]KAG9004509.1 hypothetical protein FRB93_010286 [Tulasnella sp. JGI-2019a]
MDLATPDNQTTIGPEISTNDPNGNHNDGVPLSPFPPPKRNNDTTPFHDLPEDVLQEFIYMAIGEDANTLERLLPLMAVSSGLRNFVHATPTFWNVIGSKKPDMVSRALKCSRDLPLKISIEGNRNDPSPDLLNVRKALIPQAHRIAAFLLLNLDSSSIKDLAEGLVTPNLHTFHAFQGVRRMIGLEYSPPSTLINLSLVRCMFREDPIALNNLHTLHLVKTSFALPNRLNTLLKILGGNPNLEVLSLESISRLWEAPTEYGIIELPNLRFLYLSNISGFNAFQTLCTVLHTPNLRIIRLRITKRMGNRIDEPWLNSVLGPGQPFSVFIGHWLRRACETMLMLSASARIGTDFGMFDAPGFSLHIGGIYPALVLQSLAESCQLESIQAPITLKLGGSAPDPMYGELPHLGPCIVRLPTLSRLKLEEDYMVRDILAHLSSTQLVTATNARCWPCPKLKGLSLPASAAVENTLALDFLRRQYAIVDEHAILASELRGLERLERLSIFGQVKEEPTWCSFVHEVARLTASKIRMKALVEEGSSYSDVMEGYVRALSMI